MRTSAKKKRVGSLFFSGIASAYIRIYSVSYVFVLTRSNDDRTVEPFSSIEAQRRCAKAD